MLALSCLVYTKSPLPGSGPGDARDPVMVAKGGATLLSDEAARAVKEQLLPLATIVTPNIPEAAALLGVEEVRGPPAFDLHPFTCPQCSSLQAEVRHKDILFLLKLCCFFCTFW